MTFNYIFLFPEKAPKEWKRSKTNKSLNIINKLARDKRKENINILYNTSNNINNTTRI